MQNGRIERTFSLSPGTVPTIVARTPIGSVHIHGEERSDVAVAVTIEPADALDRELEVIVEQRGDTIYAEVRGRVRGDTLFGWLRGANKRVTMEIHTPVRSNVEADGASADLHLENLTGSVRIRTASGDIRADRLTQDVTVQTASGDMRAHVLSGTIRVQTASGDVKVERGDGDLTIHSASGDVELDTIIGTLDVTTASGDCLVRSSALGMCRAKTASGDLLVTTPLAQDGEYEFTTVSGDLMLCVPQETSATVAMKTVSGDLSCALPAISEGGKRSRTMIINGGGVPVRVKSVSGDCAIHAAGEQLPPMPVRTAHTAPFAAPLMPPTPPTPPMPPTFPARPAPMSDTAHRPDTTENDFSETLAVLQAVERGEISIDEAMDKLATLENAHHGEGSPE